MLGYPFPRLETVVCNGKRERIYSQENANQLEKGLWRDERELKKTSKWLCRKIGVLRENNDYWNV